MVQFQLVKIYVQHREKNEGPTKILVFIFLVVGRGRVGGIIIRFPILIICDFFNEHLLSF